MIREAGSEGSALVRGEPRIDQARDYRFVIEGHAFPRSIDDLRPAPELAAEYGIHHLSVQADDTGFDKVGRKRPSTPTASATRAALYPGSSWSERT
jgi:hypothetical protein